MIKINEKEVKDAYKGKQYINDKTIEKIYCNDEIVYKQAPYMVMRVYRQPTISWYLNWDGDYSNMDSFKQNVDIEMDSFGYGDCIVKVKEKITTCARMFYSSKFRTINFFKFDFSEITNASEMFCRCSQLSYIPTGLNFKKITNMSAMFANTAIYVQQPFDLDTNNVTDMSSMFSNCSQLSNLDFSNSNLDNVTDMSNMFSSCKYFNKLIMDVSNNLNLNMSNMFSNSQAKTMDLSQLKTHSTAKMSNIFAYCSYLETLDISGLNIPATYSNMFNYSSKLTTIKCTKEFRDWCWKMQDYIKLPNALRQEGTGTWQEVITNSPMILSLDETDVLERDENGYPLGWFEDTAEVGSGNWIIVE